MKCCAAGDRSSPWWEPEATATRGKRPLMAQEAARQSDRLLITSDNPRFEDPQAIIDDMLAGLTAEDKKKTLAIVDRREAIRTACMLAQPGDVVLVAAQGT